MPLEAATELAESLGLGYHLGGAVERSASGASNGRAGVAALREASWLIERYIALIEQRPIGADLHAESVRLAHWGEAFAGLRAISRALEASAGEDPTPTETEPSGAEAATQPGPALLTDREALSPPRPPPPADHEPLTGPEPTRGAERNTTSSAEAEAEAGKPSFSYEVGLMAVRLGMIVVAVILIVLALTLIGQHF